MTEKIEYKKIIEGILFAWGEPLNIKDIAEIIELNTRETKNILEELILDFAENRGLKILKVKDSYQITTREEDFEWIKKLSLHHEKTRLSNAAIETLSIVAYKQPITRTQIEDIRGVKSNKVLDSLLSRELIEEVGRLEQIGRPIIYGTTDNFLKFLSIETLEDLPQIEDSEIIVSDEKE